MPRKSTYDADSMGFAISDVKNNNISLRAAAKKYGVPKSTLEFKLKNPGHKESCGPSPILTLREELKLVTWIEEVAIRGFPRKKDDILNSVQHFLIENPRPHPFKNHRPGDCWFKAFRRRHPTIVQRTSEPVSSASACVSEVDIRKWFIEIKGYLESKNIDLQDPSRIFNGDETGFQICPSTGKVFAGKGVKNVYTVDKGSQKESITVMFCFSATGMTCPPMIIYPYKRIPEKIAITVNPTWGIGRSDNGWMTSETFYDYIKNILHPHLIEKNVKFPVILFLDGHKSHLTYELSLLCNELNIEVIALYPNATRILQPCDVAVFRPIKVGWKRAVREFYEKNPGQVLNKTSFAPLLEKVVTEVVKPETLEHGFKACGLFPFNPNAIDFSKCLGKLNELSKVTQANPVMDNRTFISFIGEEILTKLKTFDAILIKEGFNNEFLTLHQIWSYFGKPDIEPKIESKAPDIELEEPENELSVGIGVMDPEIESRETDIGLKGPDNELSVGIGVMGPEIESKEPNIGLKEPGDELEVPSDSEMEKESILSIELGKPKALTNGKNDAEWYKNHENNIDLEKNIDLTAETTNSEKIHVIENTIIQEGYETSNNGTCSPCTSTDVRSLNLTQTSHTPLRSGSIIDTTSVSSVLPSTSKTCISAYLKVPDKPQRKNKRDVERISYAITSRCYQECFEVKRKLKLEEEKNKLERKRLREERVAAKANSQNKKVRMSKQIIKNGNCFVCRKLINKSSRYFTCNICKKLVHRLCIPNRHKEHIPDLEDNDLFLCHVCFKEESDEEADSEKDINENEGEENSFEPGDNKNIMDKNENKDAKEQKHDEKMEIEKDEDEEIDKLFNIYKDGYAKYLGITR